MEKLVVALVVFIQVEFVDVVVIVVVVVAIKKFLSQVITSSMKRGKNKKKAFLI
jgi:hypothetical protein